MPARHPRGTRKYGMGCSIRCVDLDRTSRVFERAWNIHRSEVRAEQGDLVQISQSKGGLGRGKPPIELGCALEEASSLLVFRRFDIGKMPHPAMITLPGVEAVSGLARRALALASLDRRQYRPGNSGGDLVLHGEDIGKLAIEPFHPEMPSGECVDELCRHSHAVPSFADAPLKDISDTQFAPDLRDRNRVALVGEARVAGDHEQESRL